MSEKNEKPPSLFFRIGKFVRFSHTVFALPFALISMLVAAEGLPHWSVFLWILVCMVAARTAAMAFNRLVDWEIDQENPRTEERHKLVTKPVANALVWISAVLFVIATTQLNLLCMVLAPVAVALIFFYSVTKRFTSYTHFFLGLALSAAPMGAWAAVTGELFSWIPYILGLAVLFWVFGFDLIYSTLDAEFDKKSGLNSMPARFGIPTTLTIARWLHVLAALVFAVFGYFADLSWGFLLAWLISVGGLIYEHKLSKKGDIGSINQAFFQVNAIVSVALFVGVSLDVFLWKS
ncbi:MAG: UbiA-like polyprenyltransferase [Verrucomicrobiota bacterium]